MLSQVTRHFAGLWLAALAVGAWGAQAPLSVAEIATGVFVHRGAVAEVTRDNGGDIANLSFVVGERCVAVIDTGSTAAIGRALLAAIRQHTRLPVCYVINTHMHFDHVFGNVAFEGDGVRFVASQRLPSSLSARAEGFLQRVGDSLGEAAEGTRPVYPTELVDTVTTLDLGGRRLVLKAWPTAHTDNDLTVYDERTATLWTGDLLFVEHLPVIDGSVRGWLAAIDDLVALGARHVVPGHGPVDVAGSDGLERERAYLSHVAATVRRAIRDGRSLREVIDAGESETVAEWQLVEAFHPRNLSAAYTELEWED
ncbi:MAG: quinoprotein relay system zinc metallohydrolase 2 [Rhodocyclaceae bacterium]|nr:quinoprotein relay system zinc metallohydrolase 2 [Rhodocyclaceae bacterium]